MDKRRDDLAERKLNHDKACWNDDVEFWPATIEAAYCIFELQDEKSPMLEKIADSLLPSVEAAGTDWLSHTWAGNGESSVFIPVIVTNATLYTLTFDASCVSMVDGTLPSGEFQTVPFIRFRKGLSQTEAGENVRNFSDANRQQQKTMLIVNAAELSGMLTQLGRQ